MKMNELKPCPFCGANARRTFPYSIVKHKARAGIKCNRCNAYMEYSSYDAAVKAWNRRVEQ